MHRLAMGFCLFISAFFAAAQAPKTVDAPCDWVKRTTVDPMTDTKTCTVRSATAGISFYRHGTDRPNVSAASAYREPRIVIRVDDNAAVSMGKNSRDRHKALDTLLPQLESGKRLRTNVEDYPADRDGDAPMCNLSALLESC